MTRIVQGWTEEQVDPAAVAEHRYRWDQDDTIPESVGSKPLDERRAWLATVPYTKGEVVYVAQDGKAVLARILHVFAEYDTWGDRRAKFRVQLATKRGTWSKAWIYTYPGFIQRGYQLAGLAPEMPAAGPAIPYAPASRARCPAHI